MVTFDFGKYVNNSSAAVNPESPPPITIIFFCIVKIYSKYYLNECN
jgi:hypothetical protein